MAEFTTPVKIKKGPFTVPQSPHLKRLGYGSGVDVYKFERSPKCNIPQSPWALKIMRDKNKQSVYGARLRTEAEFLRKMEHPYVVSFRGFTEVDGKECLMMEACSISLGDLIMERSEKNLLAFEVDKIMKMAFHISKALDYIHKRVLLLHGDVKSHNVLIKGDFDVCKLCDFGVCLPLKRNGYLDVSKIEKDVCYMGTVSWSAPEIISDSRDVTDKADIFAYGLVIWEMISLNIPHFIMEDSADSLDASLIEESELYGKILGLCQIDGARCFPSGTRPAIPDEMLGDNVDNYNNPLQLFYCCTEKNRNLRPSAYHLSVTIYEMLHPDEN